MIAQADPDRELDPVCPWCGHLIREGDKRHGDMHLACWQEAKEERAGTGGKETK